MPGFSPAQPRDPEGRWVHEKIAALKPGTKAGILGHVVDNIPSKGYRVRLKGVGSQHYQDPHEAARAVLAGKHFTPASQKAAVASQETAFRKMVTPPARLTPRETAIETEMQARKRGGGSTNPADYLHPLPKTPAPVQAHEFGRWATEVTAQRKAAPPRAAADERASHLQVQYQQANNRLRSARGPMAAQSAQRTLDSAKQELHAMGYTLSKNGQWKKKEASVPGGESPAVAPGVQRTATIQGASGPIHTRSMPVTTGAARPEPQGSKVSIPALKNENYSAHYATSGFGKGGKPNIEIWHPTEGHIATLQYNETQHQVLAKGKNFAIGTRTTKGYTYKLTHPDVLAYSKVQRQEAVQANAAYLPASTPGSVMEDKLGAQAQAAITQHEEYLARARASRARPASPAAGAQNPPSTSTGGSLAEGSKVTDANGKTRIVSRIGGNVVFFKGGGYSDISQVKPQAPATVPRQRQNAGQAALGPNYGHVTATGVSPANPGYNPTLSDAELDAAIRRARELDSPMLSMYLKIKEARQRQKVVSGNFGQQLRNQQQQNWRRQGV